MRQNLCLTGCHSDITCNRLHRSRSASVNPPRHVHARDGRGGRRNDCHAFHSRESSHALDEPWRAPKCSNRDSLLTHLCLDSTSPRLESPGSIHICKRCKREWDKLQIRLHYSACWVAVVNSPFAFFTWRWDVDQRTHIIVGVTFDSRRDVQWDTHWVVKSHWVILNEDNFKVSILLPLFLWVVCCCRVKSDSSEASPLKIACDRLSKGRS